LNLIITVNLAECSIFGSKNGTYQKKYIKKFINERNVTD